MQTIKNMQSLRMARKQKGFTIIELVVVILLLGILAATALPRFIDVTEEAHESVVQAVEGGFLTGLALYRAQWTAEGQSVADTAIAAYGSLRVAPGFDDEGAYYDGDSDDNDIPDEASTYDPLTVFSDSTAGSGYPSGLTTLVNRTDMDADECKSVFDNLLQTGAPTTFASGTLPTSANFVTDVTADQTADAADFQVYIAEALLDTENPIYDASGNPVTAPAGAYLNYNEEMPVCVYVYTAEAGNLDRILIYAPWNGTFRRVTTSDNLYAYLEDELASPVVP